MSRMQRDKGRKAEAEVRRIWEQHGFTVRGLEASGDHLVHGAGLLIHSEVKRHEVLRLPAWCRQAAAECPAGAIPVVAFRRSHESWSALVPEEAVREQLVAAGWHGGIQYSLVGAAGTWWARLALVNLAMLLRTSAIASAPQEAL